MTSFLRTVVGVPIRAANKVIGPAPAPRPEDLDRELVFPIPQSIGRNGEPDDAAEIKRLKRDPRKVFFCNICGQWTIRRIKGDTLREAVYCYHCHSYNKQRQLAAALLAGTGARSLKEYGASRRKLRVYNTETGTPIDETLKQLPNYTGSEYFAGDYQSGDLVDGVMHQDLQKTSFKRSSFDLIISCDVFEHIADPYQAHAELFRILAPGGRHLMVVPFQYDAYQDEVLASEDRSGKIVYHVKPPVYHGDPLRNEGILTFTIFGLESLVKLAEIGFQPRFYHLRDPRHGIFGKHAFVFELIKPAKRPSSKRRQRT